MALAQTLAEIGEEVSRQSWVLLDEDERDDLMRNVIVPRWGETTADGVVLKATAWARMLGATEPAIKNRYQRLTRSEAESTSDDTGSPSEPTESQEGQIRGAKAAIRRHPELAEELVKDPEVERALRQAQQRKARKDAEVSGGIDPSRDEHAESSPLARDVGLGALGMTFAAAITALGEVAAGLGSLDRALTRDETDAFASAVDAARKECSNIQLIIETPFVDADEALRQWSERT